MRVRVGGLNSKTECSIAPKAQNVAIKRMNIMVGNNARESKTKGKVSAGVVAR
jgi:hypothetical protein